MRYLTTFICLLAAVGLVMAETINVPGDYSTIQAGIDAAMDGDIVLVADGIYTGTGNKNLELDGKAIELTSESGPANCILNIGNSGRGFYLHQGETEETIISGFTITNGSMGGMFIWSCTPIIENCWILDNNTSGIYLSGASATIRKCVIAGNATGSNGGGMSVASANPLIQNCTFYGNSAAHGGAISLSNASPMINSCIISYNTVSG